MTDSSSNSSSNSSNSRRGFLAACGHGLFSVALASLLQRDARANPEHLAAWSPPSGLPHFAPKAKRVIWLFMCGGVSHVESFDPKPALNQYADKTIEESPYNDAIVNSPYYRKNVRDFAGTLRNLMPKIYPLQVGYKQHGQAGLAISDWFPHLATHADDLAIVRSMWTTDNDHAAQLQFHTGRHIFDGFYPTVGAWAHYGLAALSEDLPQFIVLGAPPADCCGGVGSHGASYLGPEHAGIGMRVDAKNPLPFGTPGENVYIEHRRRQLDLLGKLHEIAQVEHPEDAALRARVKAYELAFRMQTAAPEVMNLASETANTQSLYGLDNPVTKPFGEQCLVARRLVERGVRFVQIYHGGGGGGSWDAHSKLKENHSSLSAQVDLPIAGLIGDLKQRGLFDETLIVWGTEFGRTPGAESSDGRDHHPYGFSVWLAGGGIQGGVAHGATDELGFHAVEHRHYVTDIHATALHLLGLDPRRLELPGQKRLEIDFGEPIREIIA
jgi:hypothetical protein